MSRSSQSVSYLHHAIPQIEQRLASCVSTSSVADDRPQAIAGSGVSFSGFDCAACHAVDRRMIGPSYRDIADRYSPTEGDIGLLAERIVEGSVGVWGETPMAPHSGLELARAKSMLEQILRLQ